MCLLIFRRTFEDETAAFQVPVSVPGDMLSKRVEPQHKTSLDICINPSASPRQLWLLGRHPLLNLGETKTFTEWEKTANSYAAVKWLHWQFHAMTFVFPWSFTARYACVCVYVWDFRFDWRSSAHINPHVRGSRVNAVDRAIGLTWQSIVLISLLSLSM